MDKIRLGILGIGNQGSTYSKKILEGQCPEVELVAICDRNPKRIAWAKENLDAPITYFEDAEAMLDSGLINACIVAVPHYDHPKYAMAFFCVPFFLAFASISANTFLSSIAQRKIIVWMMVISKLTK